MYIITLYRRLLLKISGCRITRRRGLVCSSVLPSKFPCRSSVYIMSTRPIYYIIHREHESMFYSILLSHLSDYTRMISVGIYDTSLYIYIRHSPCFFFTPDTNRDAVQSFSNCALCSVQPIIK